LIVHCLDPVYGFLDEVWLARFSIFIMYASRYECQLTAANLTHQRCGPSASGQRPAASERALVLTH
jgi:hypothetical protein